NDTTNNPYLTGQTAACGAGCAALTVTVSGTPYTSNQWADGTYFIKKTSACDPTSVVCASQILSNTTNTITFRDAAGVAGLSALSFVTGETFQINRIFHVFDQPGYGQGSLLLVKCSNASATASGTTATVTCPNHGFTTGQWINAYSLGSGAGSTFTGN